MSGSRWTPWLGAIFGLGLLAYLPSFAGVFVFDDIPWIVDNTDLARWWPPWAAGRGSLRVLLFFTLAINYQLSGLAPWSYHAVNLSIHLGTALLLFGALRRTLAGTPVAASLRARAETVAGATSLLWVVHPLTTQAVTYVIQRGESLASFFYVLCFYALLRSTPQRRSTSEAGPRAAGWWGLLVVSWWAAMTSKEIAVTLPVVLFLFDGLLVSGSFGQLWRERRPLYLALAVPPALGAVALLALQPGRLVGLVRGDAEFSRLDYLISQPGAVLDYLRLLVWPLGQQVDHGRAVSAPGDAVIPLLIVVGLVGVTVFGLLRRRAWCFPALWMLLILAPSSSVVPLRDVFVEHRMYLPMVGPLFLLVWLGLTLRERRVRTGAFVLIVAVLAALTWRRNTDYRSELSLWGEAAAQTTNAKRFYNLQLEFVIEEGGVLDGPLLAPGPTSGDLMPAAQAINEGRPDRSLAVLEGLSTPAAENLRGLAWWMQGDADAASRAWTRAGTLPARVNLAVARWLDGDRAGAAELLEPLAGRAGTEGLYNVGTLRAGTGRLHEAVSALEQALAQRPGLQEAANNLGAVYEGLGRSEEAMALYRQAAETGHRTARLNLGMLSVRLRRYRQALSPLDGVLGDGAAGGLDPRAAHARALARYFTGDLPGAQRDLESVRHTGPTAAIDNNLGCVLLARGRLLEARAAFESSLRQDPSQTAAHHNLGKLLMVTGDPWRAVEHLRQAASGRPDDENLAANLREAQRLASP